MTPLTVGTYCGVSFVVLTVVTIILQVRKMKSFHKDAFVSFGKGQSNIFQGMLPIMLCGVFATFSGIGGVIALMFHFLG